ncbi:MAG: hypothetical protein ABJA71_03535 [Ginsengibacter sp.]
MQKNPEVRIQMLAHIGQWQSSGQTQKAYCTEHTIPYHVFHYWFKVYRDQNSADQQPASTFVKLKVAASSNATYAELMLPDGKRLLFHQPVASEYLKALIA